jgi:hypothetical protein
MPKLAGLVLRAQLNYQEVQDLTDWGHLMTNDYLGITQVTDVIVKQIDENTLQIEVNVENIALNAENIQINAENIQINSDNIEDLKQLAAALTLQNARLAVKARKNEMAISDNSQLVGRV